MIKKCEFEYRTIDEARMLAVYLANFCSDPSRVALGIAGLLINAVEHGNLQIGYQKKTELLNDGKWEEEIEKRLNMPELKGRKVCVRMTRRDNGVVINIKDEGKGFDPKPYMDFDPSRITDPNGRGIAMANIVDGMEVEYPDKGNEAVVTISA